MNELRLLAEDFACPKESAAPEIIGIIATKRLDACRNRLLIDLEAAGEQAALRCMREIELAETSGWRPEIGLAESAQKRVNGSPKAAALQWSLAALAESSKGSFSVRLDCREWSYFEGFHLPVSGEVSVIKDDSTLSVESKCARFEFENTGHGWRMQGWTGDDPAWRVRHIAGGYPGYITRTSLSNAINGFPWPNVGSEGFPEANTHCGDDDARAIDAALVAVSAAGHDFDAWVSGAFCGYMLMNGGGLNTAHANSSNEFPGLLALQPPNDAVHCAELLIYEASRQYASAFVMIAPLMQDGKESAFYSPLKRSYETMGRMILGAHAVGNVLLFYANLASNQALDDAARDRFDIHKIWFSNHYMRAMDQCRYLTGVGDSFWSRLRSSVLVCGALEN